MIQNRAQLNLVSLTDIVCNVIGMLVLFALMTLLGAGGVTRERKVRVEQDLGLVPIFFVCQGDRIQWIDPQEVVDIMLDWGIARANEQERRRRTDNDEPTPDSRELLAMGLRASLVDGRLIFQVLNAGRFEASTTMQDPESRIGKALRSIDPAKSFAFFFVKDELPISREGRSRSIATFQAAQDVLSRHGVKTGWRPYDDSHPPYVCGWGADPGCWVRGSAFDATEGAGGRQ